MSIKIMSRVWESAPYDGGTLLALLALADWANDRGLCWPTVASLAHKVRLSHSGAQYCIRQLVKEKAVSVVKESTGPGVPRTFQIGAQYLSPLPDYGKLKRGLVKGQKGLSTAMRNKEEPSGTIKIKSSGIESGIQTPTLEAIKRERDKPLSPGHVIRENEPRLATVEAERRRLMIPGMEASPKPASALAAAVMESERARRRR